MNKKWDSVVSLSGRFISENIDRELIKFKIWRSTIKVGRRI
jgi:hypothetical protein